MVLSVVITKSVENDGQLTNVQIHTAKLFGGG